MKTSDIITSQFVSLTQTPAGVAERLVARIIDYIVIGVYFFALWTAFDKYNWLLDPLGLGDSLFRVLYILLLLSPILFYSVICEFFLDGRTLGKMVMKTRVVMVDGSAPTLGAILLRWLFLLIDVYLMNIGIIAIICTRRNQRLGDLAAGTMVIRTPRTDQMHFTLSEFSYARSDYKPLYPEVQQLSLGQIDVVNHILNDQDRAHARHQARARDGRHRPAAHRRPRLSALRPPGDLGWRGRRRHAPIYIIRCSPAPPS